MQNIVALVGRFTKNPDLRHTGSGTSVVQFTLAVQRNYKNQQGEYEADFINCVIWRKGAETIAQYCKKGDLIDATGSLQTRRYDDKDEKRVFVTEVNVEHFSFLITKGDKQQNNNGQQQNNLNNAMGNVQQQYNTGQQQNNQNNSSNVDGMITNSNNHNNGVDPYMSNGQATSISDDDLPF